MIPTLTPTLMTNVTCLQLLADSQVLWRLEEFAAAAAAAQDMLPRIGMTRSRQERLLTLSWCMSVLIHYNGTTMLNVVIRSILFFVTLCSTIWWVVKEKNLIGSFGSSAHANQPQAHQDAAGANVPMTAPQQPTATYAQPQMQQSQYYQEQTQPQTQYSQPQSGYPNPQLSSAAPIYTGGAPIAGH